MDDLVIDENPISRYARTDNMWTKYVKPAFVAVRQGDGKPSDCPQKIWTEVEEAKRTCEGWTENINYKYHNGKYRDVNEKGQATSYVSMALDYLNFISNYEPDPPYSTTWFVTCTPYIFNQYECIFGLTGSVGGQAERDYLLKTYNAEVFTAPRFLDTCTGDIPKVVKRDDVRVFKSERRQHKAIVKLACEKCAQVPVLIIVDHSQQVEQMAGLVRKRNSNVEVQTLLQEKGGQSMASEWDDLTEKACKPVEGKKINTVGRWRVTVTDYFGGRGIDYRLANESANDAGGMLVVITAIPKSQREWIQWEGRTARQDKNGQISVLLHKDLAGQKKQTADSMTTAELIRACEGVITSDTDEQEPSIIEKLLEKRNEERGSTLEEYATSLSRGNRLNELCEDVHREGGGRGAGWPTQGNQEILRDFLQEKGDHSHSEDAVAQIRRKMVRSSSKYSPLPSPTLLQPCQAGSA